MKLCHLNKCDASVIQMEVCGARDYVAMGLHSHGKPISICRIQENFSALSTPGGVQCGGEGSFNPSHDSHPRKYFHCQQQTLTRNLSCICWHWWQQHQSHLKCGLTKAQPEWTGGTCWSKSSRGGLHQQSVVRGGGMFLYVIVIPKVGGKKPLTVTLRVLTQCSIRRLLYRTHTTKTLEWVMAVSNIRCLALEYKKNLTRAPALPKYLPAAVDSAARHLSDRPFQVAKTKQLASSLSSVTLGDWQLVLIQCANRSTSLEGKQPQPGGS